MDRSLVKLVENDGPEGREERILLKACRQDAFGGHED
jgi:hypothetical protein